jgi:oligogalacturonide transport system substrate-binding protein
LGFAKGGEQQDMGKPQQVTLRMSWWGNEARHKAHLAAIARYQELNPHVTIEAEYGGMEGYRQKITTQLSGRQEPDLMWIDPTWLNEFMKQGDFFVNLYDYKDVLDLSKFDQKLLDDYLIYDGKLVGLSTGINAQVIVVDSKLADLGVQLDGPWSWEKLIDAGKKVQQSDKDKHLILIESKFMNVIVLRAYMIQLTGKTLFSDDYKPNFTEAQLVQGLTLVQQLYENKVVEPIQAGDVFLQTPTTNPKWVNGSFYGVIGWSTNATRTPGFPKERMTSIAFPQIPGSANSGIKVQVMPPVCISKNSKNVMEAVKFLNYYLLGEGAQILSVDRPFPPTVEGQRANVEAGIVPKGYFDAVSYSTAHAGVKNNVISDNTELEDAMLDMVQAVGYGKYTPQQAAREGYVKLADILKRIKQ